MNYEKDRRILKLMIEKIDRITEIVTNHPEQDINANYIYSDSLQFEFEKLYEDGTRLSEEILRKNPDFPLTFLRGIRNRIAHDYDSVSISVLIDTAINDLPKLKAQIEKLL